MKYLGMFVAMALMAMASGCSFLTSKGVLSQDDVAALCKDAVLTCSVAASADVDEDVKKACAAVAVVCVAQPAE